MFDFRRLDLAGSPERRFYIYDIVDLSNVPMKNIDCYECTLPLFFIDTQTFIMNSITSPYQFGYTAYSNGFPSKAPFF